MKLKGILVSVLIFVSCIFVTQRLYTASLPSVGDTDWGETLINFLKVTLDEDTGYHIHPFIDVKSGGVVGGGVTNDTVAIQAVIDAWEADDFEKKLKFPSGTFLIDALTITAPSNNLSAWIEGDGLATVFKLNDAIDAFTINMGSGSWQQLRIEGIAFNMNGKDGRCIVTTGTSGLKARYENIWITGNSATATKALIDLGTNDHVTDLINININGHANKVGTGIDIDSNVVNIDHCNIILMNKAININTNTTGININQNRLDQNNYGICADTAHVVNLRIDGNQLETIGEAGVYLKGANSTSSRIFNAQVINNYFSSIANTKYGCYFENIDGLEVKNNRFDGVSGALSINWAGQTSNASLLQNTVGASGMSTPMTNGATLFPYDDVTVNQFDRASQPFVVQTFSTDGEESTMTGNETFTKTDGNVFIKDPGGADRTFNPDGGGFATFHPIILVNTADDVEKITFDSEGLGEEVLRYERAIFVYNGSSWVCVNKYDSNAGP